MTLGTAIAASGAADDPTFGLSSSRFVNFLLSLFNARFGIWLGNPNSTGRRPTYRREGPRLLTRVIFDEVFGITNEASPYVRLSDGGHFENLGLYEMVRRRCGTIVVTDAGIDPTYDFESLANAIRKIRLDLGIPITFTAPLRIKPKPRSGAPAKNARYCALASIHYGAVDKGGATGTLVYIKATICGLPPFDVGVYARRSRDFPQETTVGRLFSEAQFESYRALGEAVVAEILGGKPPVDLSGLIKRVHEYIEPSSRLRGA